MPTPDSYRLPPVRLDVAGSAWLADTAVSSWRVERELIGSTLPGQVRHRSGFSIGSASATVTQEGRLLTPWSRDPSRQVVNGDRARLVAEVDADATVLDDCSSTSGWSLIGTSLSSDGESIFYEGPDPSASPPDLSLLRRQEYVSMGAFTLLAVDYEASHPIEFLTDGQVLPPVRRVADGAVTTDYYAAPASFYFIDFRIEDEVGPTFITVHEVRQVYDGVRLGQWVVDRSGGSLLGSGVEVELLEAQYAARKPDARLAPIDYAFAGSDAVSVVAQAAALAGYHAVPPPSSLAIMAAPLVGGWDAPTHLNSSRPTTLLGESPNGWDAEMMGIPAMASGGVAILSRPNSAAFFERQASGQFTYITLNVDGVAAIWNDSFDLGWAIEIDAAAGTLRCTNHYNGFVDPVVWSTAVSFSTGDDPTWPNRVQLVLQRDVSGTGEPGDPWQPTEFRVWARSAWGADWSDPATSTEPSPGSEGQVIDQVTFDGGNNFWGNTPGLGSRLGGIQITNAALAELFRPPTADLSLMGGNQAAPWIPPGTDVWTAIQNQCGAWGAAGYLTADGFRLLTQDDLSGVGVPGEPVDVGAEWTDLPWVLDTADTADRLVVSYNPPAWRERNTDTLWDPVAWEADEVISVPANSSIVVKAVLDRYAEGIHAGVGVGLWNASGDLPTPNPEPEYQSSYSYYTNPEGAGSKETSGLSFFSQVISATEVHWHFTNNTGATLYLVNADGDPHLTIRASRVATFDEAQVIERGLSADEARNPLPIDLSYHVQSEDDARDLADFYWARVSSPKWRASSVRCRLDWDHDLGRVIAPSHARTGLEEKALVTKVSYEGQPGEYAQTVDLVLLPPTWGDFDLAWAGQTWADFDTAWSAATWADFDNDPLSTTGGA